jgi:hypothetical protein
MLSNETFTDESLILESFRRRFRELLLLLLDLFLKSHYHN